MLLPILAGVTPAQLQQLSSSSSAPAAQLQQLSSSSSAPAAQLQQLMSLNEFKLDCFRDTLRHSEAIKLEHEKTA
jgi:hypothetical protein